jgi:Domain of unknown function (DUF4404)
MNTPPEERPGKETLTELLAHVRERLSGAGKVDAHARQQLGALTQDIERALGGGAKPDRVKPDSLPRLEALAVRFEAEHPALAPVLRELIDELGKAGL